MQIPIGREDEFDGVVDLVTMKAIYFDGTKGEKVREDAIPAGLQKEATAARTHMLEALSMYSDKLMEMLLERETISEELIHDIIRHAVIEQEFTPVYLGHGVSQQGRAAAAGRDRRVTCPRRSMREVKGKDPIDQEQGHRAFARSRQAVRRHGVQDRR